MNGKPAPDAARSFLGHYSIINPVVPWLLEKALELLAEDASRVQRSNAYAPLCPHPFGARHRMVLRSREWCCYRHGAPIRKSIDIQYPRAPHYDALKAAQRGKALDYQWDDDLGRYIVLEMDL